MSSHILLSDICPEFAKLVEMIPVTGVSDSHSEAEDDESLSFQTPEFCLELETISFDKSQECRERSGSGLSTFTQSSLKEYSAKSTQANTHVEINSVRSSKDLLVTDFLSCFGDRQVQPKISTDLELNCLKEDFEGLQAETKPHLSSESSLDQQQIDQNAQFQIEIFRQNEFVSTISKLIDQQPLRLSDLDSLDGEQLILLSNFTKMLFDTVLSSEADMVSQLENLNSAISSAPEKKKRNEERIKFTFKRANKMLLKRFVQFKQLESLSEEQTQKLFIEHFFSSEKSYTHQEFQALQELIFKPRNIYRRELKQLFQFGRYTEEFVFALESLLYDEYLKKRRTKILGLCDQIREELYYRSDKSSASVLQKIMKRMPWSASEAKKGLDLMLEIISSS